MKNKILLLTLILLISLPAGCTSKKFESSYKQFKESYILATTDFVDKDSDDLKALKMMNIDLVETELKKMKESMDSMSTEVNSKEEKGVYGNVKMFYQGLEFLLYAAKNYEKLSFDEKQKVYLEVAFVSTNREEMANGEL